MFRNRHRAAKLGKGIGTNSYLSVAFGVSDRSI
jgi:hypothetical protein